MITHTAFLSVILCSVGFLVPMPVYGVADPGKEKPSVFDQLQQEEAIAVTLRTDLTRLLADLKSDTYQDGVLVYPAPGGGELILPVEIRLRGRYRRRVCEFPPVKLKFSRKVLHKEGLDTVYRSLKLVTHCSEDKTKGNEAVLREFLAYKLYSLLTEHSYRVQLLDITYADTENKVPALRRYGFFVEDTDEMAQRLSGKECEECMNPSPQQLSAKDAALVAVFQYMIGNSDWDPVKMRNLKLVLRGGDGKDLLVPYDFDFSGIVNVPYARPNPDYALKSIRDRILMGFPAEDPHLKWALNYTKFKKEELYKFVRRFRPLGADGRYDVLSYLSFYFDYLDQLQVNRASNLYAQLAGTPLRYVGGP